MPFSLQHFLGNHSLPWHEVTWGKDPCRGVVPLAPPVTPHHPGLRLRPLAPGTWDLHTSPSLEANCTWNLRLAHLTFAWGHLHLELGTCSLLFFLGSELGIRGEDLRQGCRDFDPVLWYLFTAGRSIGWVTAGGHSCEPHIRGCRCNAAPQACENLGGSGGK